MKNSGKTLLLLFITMLGVWVQTGCAPSSLSPTSAIANLTPMPTVSLTSTFNPAPTATSTLLPPATLAPTVIPSPTPTRALFNPLLSLKPGQYLFYRVKTDALGVISADGQAKLEFSASSTEFSELSPDRKKLVLKYSLQIAELDGGENRNLAINNCSAATWSPDGTQLVASCDRLYLFSLTTGKKVELPEEHASIENVKWSPDGKWIAAQTYTSMAIINDGVFLMSTACFAQPANCSTSNYELVPFSYIYPAPYAWSPDSKYLVFANWIIKLGRKENDIVLDLFDIQTRKVQRSIEISGSGFKRQDNYTLGWSPDGKWIAFDQADGIYKVPVEGGAPVLVVHVPTLHHNVNFQWISIPHPFAPGAKYTITPAGNGLNLRDQPSQAGKPLKVLKAGDEITIVKGPTLADGYTWWQMRTKDGVEGWAEDLPDWYQ